MSRTQETLFGVGWLVVGVTTAVAGQVLIGLVIIAFGVFVLLYSRSKAQKGNRTP